MIPHDIEHRYYCRIVALLSQTILINIALTALWVGEKLVFTHTGRSRCISLLVSWRPPMKKHTRINVRTKGSQKTSTLLSMRDLAQSRRGQSVDRKHSRRYNSMVCLVKATRHCLMKNVTELELMRQYHPKQTIIHRNERVRHGTYKRLSDSSQSTVCSKSDWNGATVARSPGECQQRDPLPSRTTENRNENENCKLTCTWDFLIIVRQCHAEFELSSRAVDFLQYRTAHRHQAFHLESTRVIRFANINCQLLN